MGAIKNRCETLIVIVNKLLQESFYIYKKHNKKDVENINGKKV